MLPDHILNVLFTYLNTVSLVKCLHLCQSTRVLLMAEPGILAYSLIINPVKYDFIQNLPEVFHVWYYAVCNGFIDRSYLWQMDMDMYRYLYTKLKHRYYEFDAATKAQKLFLWDLLKDKKAFKIITTHYLIIFENGKYSVYSNSIFPSHEIDHRQRPISEFDISLY